MSSCSSYDPFESSSDSPANGSERESRKQFRLQASIKVGNWLESLSTSSDSCEAESDLSFRSEAEISETGSSLDSGIDLPMFQHDKGEVKVIPVDDLMEAAEKQIYDKLRLNRLAIFETILAGHGYNNIKWSKKSENRWEVFENLHMSSTGNHFSEDASVKTKSAYSFTCSYVQFGRTIEYRGIAFQNFDVRPAAILEVMEKIREHPNIRIIRNAFIHQASLPTRSREMKVILTDIPSMSLREFFLNIKPYGVMRSLRAIFRQLFNLLKHLHKNGIYLKDLDCPKVEIDVSEGPKETADITLKILEVSASLNDVTEENGVYVFPSTWFFREGICGKARTVATNNILEYADLMLVHNFYEMLKKLSRVENSGFQWFCVASTKQELKEAEKDERVSRNFINCLNHLMQHLKSGNIKLFSMDSHCFFLNSSQILDLVSDAVELGDDPILTAFRDEVFTKHKNFKSAFDTYDFSVSIYPEVGYNWRVRINHTPRLDTASPPNYINTGGNTPIGKYVELNRRNNMNGAMQASSTVASFFTQYSHARTLYLGEELLSLFKVIRNVRTHWLKGRGLSYSLKTSLCPVTARLDYDPGTRDIPDMCDEFLNYWTRRFPGLVTVVYTIVVTSRSKGLNGSLKHRDLNPMTTVSDNLTMDEDSGKPFNYEATIEPVEQPIPFADMPKL